MPKDYEINSIADIRRAGKSFKKDNTARRPAHHKAAMDREMENPETGKTSWIDKLLNSLEHKEQHKTMPKEKLDKYKREMDEDYGPTNRGPAHTKRLTKKQLKRKDSFYKNDLEKNNKKHNQKHKNQTKFYEKYMPKNMKK